MFIKKLKIILVAFILPFIASGQDFNQSYFLENGSFISEHIDADGKEDVVAAYYGFSTGLQFYKNNYAVDNMFELVASVNLNELESNIVSIDYDLDGDNDFIVSDNTPKALLLIKNEGNNVFKSEKLALKPATMLLSGDADKDGIKEIYAFDKRTKVIEVITIKNKVFTSKVISTDLFIVAMALVNLNNSPQEELLVAPSNLSDLTLGYIEKTNSTYTYKASPLSIPDDELNQLIIADINKDGYKDIVTAGEDGLSTFLLDKNGVGTLKVLNKYTGSKFFGYTALTVDDFNGDGHPDIVSTDNETNYLYINDGSLSFKEDKTFCTVGGIRKFSTIDIDGDKDRDILVSNSELWLLENNLPQLTSSTTNLYSTRFISIYPNPAVDVVNITTPDFQTARYVIYDVMGKVVQKGVVDNGKVGVSELIRGAYVIGLESDGVVVNGWIVKLCSSM